MHTFRSLSAKNNSIPKTRGTRTTMGQPLTLTKSSLYTTQVELILQWLLSVASFQGTSQIVFCRSGLGRRCATGVFSHCQASNRELPAQKLRHILHLECQSLSNKCLTLRFSQWSRMKPSLQARRRKNEQLCQVPVLFTHFCSLPDNMTEFHI